MHLHFRLIRHSLSDVYARVTRGQLKNRVFTKVGRFELEIFTCRKRFYSELAWTILRKLTLNQDVHRWTLVPTWKRYDGVDLHRVYRFSVSGNQNQIVPLNRKLRWTHRSKRVDHPEPVSLSRCDRENFQRSVRLESSIGISELSFSIDQQAFGILSGVNSQSSRESLNGIFVHPVAQKHDVCGQIKIVEVTVGVPGRRLSDGNAAVQTVHFL